MHRQGIDSKITPVQVFPNGRGGYRRQCRRKLIILRPGSCHIYFSAIGKNNYSGPETFVDPGSALQTKGQFSGQHLAAAFHHQVQIIIGDAQIQIPDKTAHTVHFHLKIPGCFSRLNQNFSQFPGQSILYQTAEIIFRDRIAGVKQFMIFRIVIPMQIP